MTEENHEGYVSRKELERYLQEKLIEREGSTCCAAAGECMMLDEEKLDFLAERAADRAIKKMTEQLYQEVGKGLITKIFSWAGVLAVIAWVFLQHKK